MAKDAPLAIEVPNADRDRPAWVKVGVIAAVGFVVGIAWPRIMGVRLGPSAPNETAGSSSASSHAGRAPDSPPASVAKTATPTPSASVATAPSASASATPGAGLPPNIAIQKGAVISCKTEGGDTKRGNKDCGSVPGIDALVLPRVKKVATCSGALGQTGKLSLVVNADFSSGRFWYDVGKSSTLQNVDAVTACLKTTFHGTSTTATQHEHPRYTVAYNATFTPGTGSDPDEKPGAAASAPHKSEKNAKDEPPKEKEKDEPQPAVSTGEAIVAWEVALVRDAPKTGGLVSRLARGTKVKVGTTKDGWYLIKFGDNFANEGWVYRGAIGR